MNKMKMNLNAKKKGFTLVELIVVLVILAILAAILIPALLGYIDRAREKQDVLDARNLLMATQAELTDAYAKNGDKLQWGETILPGNGEPIGDNDDVDLVGTDFAKRVLKTADMEGDKEPYVFMFAVGSNCDKNSNTNDKKLAKHAKYTVYYALYIKDKDSVPYYYYNGTWSKKNPRGKGGDGVELFTDKNRIKSGELKDMRLQYYLISNKTGKEALKGDFWNILKITLDEKWNGKKK